MLIAATIEPDRLEGHAKNDQATAFLTNADPAAGFTEQFQAEHAMVANHRRIDSLKSITDFADAEVDQYQPFP
jgi:hypothetical protein